MEEYSTLSNFFRSIWREEKGFVYLALKDKENNWKQRFFEWPGESHAVIDTTVNNRENYDVYFAPAIFNERSSKKEHVKGAHCVWVEFDGSNHPELGDIPEPNIVVQTSSETHQHLYWSTDTFLEGPALEQINRALTYKLEADSSGWDCNQVLRPPETINHKKSLSTKLLACRDIRISSVAISATLPKRLPDLFELPKDIPPAKEVWEKYEFPPEVESLFRNGVSQDRSAGLMALGYHLAERGLSNLEIFSLVCHADVRWGKFSRRSDRDERIREIVIRAREKYPIVHDGAATERPRMVGALTFLSSTVELTWVWQDYLQDNGYFLCTGATGVGKTQLSLNFGAHAVLGKPFLGKEIIRPQRIAFISLEMGEADLRYFFSHQIKDYTPEECAVLEENFLFFPQGFSLPLNREEVRTQFEKYVLEHELDGLIFDSLGSMTSDDLSKEGVVREIMDWNDRLRNRYNLFTWLIHHPRKSQDGNRRPNRIDDVFGSQYVTARATTVVNLRALKENLIEFLPLKIRLAPKSKAMALKRNPNLNYEVSTTDFILEDTEVDLTDAAVEAPIEDDF